MPRPNEKGLARRAAAGKEVACVARLPRTSVTNRQYDGDIPDNPRNTGNKVFRVAPITPETATLRQADLLKTGFQISENQELRMSKAEVRPRKRLCLTRWKTSNIEHRTSNIQLQK
jgi:hypothetical protein